MLEQCNELINKLDKLVMKMQPDDIILYDSIKSHLEIDLEHSLSILKGLYWVYNSEEVSY